MIPALIRPAQACDIDGIVDLESRCFSDPWSRATFLDLFSMMAEGLCQIVVAERDGSVVGFGVGEGVEPELHISNLAVDPKWRGLGIGRALLRALLDWGRRLGLEEAWLEVRESNQAALGLYESMGFVVTGTRKSYYRKPSEDALLMMRPLEDAHPVP